MQENPTTHRGRMRVEKELEEARMLYWEFSGCDAAHYIYLHISKVLVWQHELLSRHACQLLGSPRV